MEDQALTLVIQWITHHTGKPAEQIQPDSLLADVLGDPLDLVAFVMHFEDSGLELPELQDPKTVRNLANWIRRAREY